MTCSVDRCEKSARIRGWCSAHYKRWLRYGNPCGTRPRRTQAVDEAAGTKRCSRCGEWKPLDAFGSDTKRSSGRRARCLSCDVEVTRQCREARTPEQIAAHKAWRRDYQLLWLYGITIKQYEQLLASQGGVCICGAKAPTNGRLHVDHNHETGAVRGLLCRDCNVALGLTNDDPARLRKLVDYLESDRCARSPANGSGRNPSQ